jgi:hypothetical protein
MGEACHRPYYCEELYAGVFTLFTMFFDGAKRHFDCKNYLVVKVQSLKSGLCSDYSTNVLFLEGSDNSKEETFGQIHHSVRTPARTE